MTHQPRNRDKEDGGPVGQTPPTIGSPAPPVPPGHTSPRTIPQLGGYIVWLMPTIPPLLVLQVLIRDLSEGGLVGGVGHVV